MCVGIDTKAIIIHFTNASLISQLNTITKLGDQTGFFSGLLPHLKLLGQKNHGPLQKSNVEQITEQHFYTKCIYKYKNCPLIYIGDLDHPK